MLREPPGANAIVVSDYFRCGPRWYARQARHLRAYPIEERVAEVEAPVLIVRGERDPIARLDWCRRLAARSRRSPHASVLVVPRRAHAVQHTAPGEVATAILAFAAVSR